MGKFTCPVCGKEVDKKDTDFTYDVMGIPYRRVCNDCYFEIMNSDKGYDGRDYRMDCSEAIW